MKVQDKLAIDFIRAKINLLAAVSPARAGEEAFRLFCTPLSRYAGNEAEVFKKGEKLAIEIGGKVARGYRCNAPQEKKTLLLHGFSSSCHKFSRYAEEMIGKGYEVLAFDMLGHGSSDGNTANALEYSQLIEKINHQYGPINAYIAHSFGGIGVALALENIPHTPETKVVLIAPATETTTAVGQALTFLKLSNPAIRKALDNAIYIRNKKDTSWYSVRRALQNITASILWIHDRHDEITPFADVQKVIDDRLPNVTFKITESMGHHLIYRAAETRKAVSAFL